MNTTIKASLLILLLALMPSITAFAGKLDGCTYKGKPLYGKVKVVTALGDFKVRVVSGLADMNVKVVTAFPDSCGEWQFVDALEDFSVEFVDALADFSIEYVNAFPGVKH